MKSLPSRPRSRRSLRNLAGHCRDAVCFLTRQLAMRCQTGGASGDIAITAKVMAASGMWLQSSLTAFRARAPRADLQPVGAAGDLCAHGLSRVDDECRPDRSGTPRLPARGPAWTAGKAPAAMKYEADEASVQRGFRLEIGNGSLAGAMKHSQPWRYANAETASSGVISI